MKNYFLIFLFTFTFSLYGAEYDLIKGQAMSLSCASCHGTDGVSHSAMPSINGIDKTILLESLQDFKNGRRPSTVMIRHVKGFSDYELEQIAYYFSKIKR